MYEHDWAPSKIFDGIWISKCKAVGTTFPDRLVLCYSCMGRIICQVMVYVLALFGYLQKSTPNKPVLNYSDTVVVLLDSFLHLVTVLSHRNQSRYFSSEQIPRFERLFVIFLFFEIYWDISVSRLLQRWIGDGVNARDSLLGVGVTLEEHAALSADTFQTSTRQNLINSKVW